MSILEKGKTLLDKVKPMLMDTGNGPNKPNDASTETSTIPTSTKITPLKFFSSFFNGAGIGLLLGILLGLAISPVVSTFIGTLSGLLAVLLGLSEKYISPIKGIRLGAFGFFCVGGIFLGMYVRTNNRLLPKRSDMMKDYMNVGFTEEEARDFIAYREFRLIPPGWNGGGEAAEDESTEANTSTTVEVDNQQNPEKSNTSKAVVSKTTASPKKKSKRQFANPDETGAQFANLLYSSNVNLSKCYKLNLLNGDVVSLKEIKNTFRIADGKEKGIWTQLANNIDPSLPETIQIKALLAIRDCFCEDESLSSLEITDCKKVEALKPSTSLDEYVKKLKAINPLWKAIGEKITVSIPKEHQSKVFQSITKNLCHE